MLCVFDVMRRLLEGSCSKLISFFTIFSNTGLLHPLLFCSLSHWVCSGGIECAGVRLCPGEAMESRDANNASALHGRVFMLMGDLQLVRVGTRVTEIFC